MRTAAKVDASQADTLPWTERQFQKAMRDADYKNMGQGCWQHKQTGRKFYAWTWTRDEVNDVEVYGEQWRRWADVRQTPSPF